ncbi:MAG: hypothetical protein A3J55_02595 [Candidatus Ryanbacteria bacterium RIFCSPHIGHO2_02_FULL_45_17b]|uniref:NAD-dependent epimerase/dehydratase domain-containing protein n=1 Tax=Candidatus Ryanbacteria bacterium RIFCSPHIGHO2_01_FULL_45_22 TaxID=1802114 RepID=A0A1G2FYX2_9BACT|nr:MAG: hypothetical protein A2719_01035 [Candidatus Ryanbacteria bacterium RIFCSPHIGHO2_01_FULL_45_22]OGZ46816.1 MAG: hypothetical protein A3J55_02595 [Candidatus Ryanbacteria bacterium RIFCSPHIGHO2_02_FULL_45_17b]
MNILLTGGSGFIGKHIIELLGKKYTITAPSHRELDILDLDAVRTFLQAGKFDIVIHAANVGGKRNQGALTGVYETNRRMFLNLAENSNLFGRMIFLGSGAEYGKQGAISMVREEDFGKVQPLDEYGRAKYAASEYIREHEHILNLRCFGVFGTYEDYSVRFISNAICRSLFGLPIVMHQNVKFDYLYAPDLVGIIEYFIINQPSVKFYNAGFGKPIELVELAQMVKQVANSDLEIEIEQPGYGNEYSCDASRLKAEIKNMAFTSYEMAITEMVAYYKSIISKISREDLDE